MKLDWPRIETDGAWITLGVDKDLNKALDLLKANTIKFLSERDNVSDGQATETMIANWDCRVSQVVNINKGLHCFSAKTANERREIEALPKAETGAYLVTAGIDTDLNKAMDQASWAMIELLQTEKQLSRLDAYGLASMVMDCRLAPPSQEQKEVYCLVPKSVWVASR
jgi:acetamidase/formamidase